jgi:DNA repair protein RadA/Sms
LQALAVKTVYAYPKRVASGVPLSRLQVLTAALDKYAGLGLHEYDIYVNVARGVKLTDPALDMALAVAIGSSVKSRQMGKVIAFGELNLSGSFSPAAFESRRLQEASRLGYKYIVTPQNVPHLSRLSQVLAKKG